MKIKAQPDLYSSVIAPKTAFGSSRFRFSFGSPQVSKQEMPKLPQGQDAPIITTTELDPAQTNGSFLSGPMDSLFVQS